MTIRAADDFTAIGARLKELREEEETAKAASWIETEMQRVLMNLLYGKYEPDDEFGLTAEEAQDASEFFTEGKLDELYRAAIKQTADKAEADRRIVEITVHVSPFDTVFIPDLLVE
jgi:hypothetical protein